MTPIGIDTSFLVAVEAAGHAQGFIAREMLDRFSADEEKLARAFLNHLISYATGAPVSFADRAEVNAILAKTKSKKYGVRSLLVETVASPLFSKP